MTSHERILVVDDEEQMRDLLVKVLERKGYQVSVCGNGAEALAFLEREPADLVVTDVRMPGLTGMEALRAIKELNPEIVVIIMTAFGSIDQAVQAVKEGAYDYINKPFKIDEMLLTIEKALEERRLRHEVSSLRQELRTRYHFENLIGKSRAMQEIFGLIEQVAGSRSTVMVYGKSGTGKELVAKAIHYNSPRSAKAFVAVNCAAIPADSSSRSSSATRRGPSPGPSPPRWGSSSCATGGTLFLDEIGSHAPRPPGEDPPGPPGAGDRAGRRHPDHQDRRPGHRRHQPGPEEGRRGGDLPRGPVLPAERRARSRCPTSRTGRRISRSWPTTSSRSSPRSPTRPSARSPRRPWPILMSHTWPGNVRELENVIERAVTLGRGPAVLPRDLPPHLAGGTNPLERALAKEATLEDLEKRLYRHDSATHQGTPDPCGLHPGDRSPHPVPEDPALQPQAQRGLIARRTSFRARRSNLVINPSVISRLPALGTLGSRL